MAFDSVFCQVHQIQITSYCESCKDGICWKCFKLHKGHKVYALQYIFPKYQAIAMNEILPKIYRDTRELENVHSCWETSKLSVEKSIDSFQKGLSKQFNSIILALSRKEKTLMAMMKESRSKAISQCEKEISHANKLKNNLEDLKLDAYNIAYSGTSSSVLGYKDLKMNLMSVDEEILKCLQNKKSSLKDQLCEYQIVNIEEILKAVDNLNLRERKEEGQHDNKHRQTEEEKRKKSRVNTSRKRKFEGADLDKESNNRNKTAKKDSSDYSPDPFHDKKQFVSQYKKLSALKNKLSNKKRLKSKDLYNSKQLHRKKDLLNAKTKASYVDHDRMKDGKAEGSVQVNYTFQRPTVLYDDIEMFADSFACSDIISKEQDFSYSKVYKNFKNKNNDNRKNVKVNKGNQLSQDTINKTNQSERRKDNQQKLNVSAKLSLQKSKVCLNDKSDLGSQFKIVEKSDLEKNQDVQIKSSDNYIENKTCSSVKTGYNIQSAEHTIKLGVQPKQSTVQANPSAVQAYQSTIQTNHTDVQAKQSTVQSSQSNEQAKQSSVQSNQPTVQSNLSAVQTKQSTVQSNLSAVQTKQSTVHLNLSAVQTKQSTVQSNQSAVQTKQSTVQSKQSTVQPKQSTVQPKQSTVQSRQSNEQAKQPTVQSNLLAVQTKQSTVQSNQSAVQTKQFTEQPKQSTVQSKQSTVQPKQSTVQHKQSTVQSRQSNEQAKQPTVQSNLSAVQTKQSTVQSNLSAVQTKQPTVQSKQSTVQSNLSEVQANLSTIQTIKSEVQCNQSTVNLSAIQTNQSTVKTKQSTVHAKVSAVQTKPKEIQLKPSTVQSNQYIVQSYQFTVQSYKSAEQTKTIAAQSNQTTVQSNQLSVQSSASGIKTEPGQLPISCNKTSPVVKAEPIDTEPGQVSVTCDETSPVVKTEPIDTSYEQQQITQVGSAEIKVEPTDDYFDKLEDDIQAAEENNGKENKETNDLNENQSLQIKDATVNDETNEIFVESLVGDITDKTSSKNCADEFVLNEDDKWNVLEEIVDETVEMLSSDQVMKDVGGLNDLNLGSQGQEVNKIDDENIEQLIEDQEMVVVNDENNNKENFKFNNEYLNLRVTVDNDYSRNGKDLESWETADDMTEETNNQPASILVQKQDKEPGPGFSNPSQSDQCHQLQKDNYNDTALEVIDLTNQRHVCYPHIPLYPNNVQLSDYTSTVSYYIQPGFSTQVDPANFNFSRQQQQSFCDANLSQQASSVESYADKAFSEDRNNVGLCERRKQRTNDNMLENLKHNKLPNLQLQDIIGHVVEFLLDSVGSQFVLSKLPRAAREETSVIVNEILTSGQFITLCKSPSGHHVLQILLIKTLSEQSHCLAMKLFGNIVQLTLHPYGSKVILQALSTSTVQIQKGILKELERSVLHCMTDSIGNHVIQKCIEIFSPQYLRTVIETCKDQLTTLCTDIHGCKVLQKLITHCVLWRTKPIRESILDQSDELVQDPNGVEVIMCVLQKGTPEDKNRILNWLKGDLLSHCVQRFNSYLVETCLTCLQPDQKAVLIKEVCLMNDIAFRTILTDRYASSIVQRMIDVAKPHQRRVLVMKIQPYRSTLSNSYLWKDAAALNSIEN
ncbi:pumilio RNA-binding family [Mytilus galloprovincialis]|uniref:Pumilio RNA-binding family n=1 Tax=Mytilus galloprovincialis TaxID=29158 RepID=A0A8B6BM60_MYTGA|nr:pumilio RNA-binding family [Mytilus galloprovincialis]